MPTEVTTIGDRGVDRVGRPDVGDGLDPGLDGCEQGRGDGCGRGDRGQARDLQLI